MTLHLAEQLLSNTKMAKPNEIEQASSRGDKSAWGPTQVPSMFDAPLYPTDNRSYMGALLVRACGLCKHTAMALISAAGTPAQPGRWVACSGGSAHRGWPIHPPRRAAPALFAAFRGVLFGVWGVYGGAEGQPSSARGPGPARLPLALMCECTTGGRRARSGSSGRMQVWTGTPI